MTQNNDIFPSHEQWLSAKTIDYLKSDEAFVCPEAVLDAIATIVIAVHDSYECPDDSVEDLLKTIVALLQQRPVANQYMQINRTDLAKKPLMMQLLILMQNIVIKQQLGQSVQQLVWLSIAMHTAALLIVQDKKPIPTMYSCNLRWRSSQHLLDENGFGRLFLISLKLR